MADRPNKSFSLASLMLFVLVIALVVSQVMMARQLASTRAELDAVRQAYKAFIDGKIQPPGGVPLSAWAPGTPIPVDPLRKLAKRLEAAPQKDLDKWVVELERITDEKFDTNIERQGCRTDFVNRMSVAFDGLTWDAKTADKLFQRAQTMPVTEARVWKEAFEALFEKEFTYAHVIPLVLIPVEALHEGQKYSAERGKKYLARMKQLTAHDVSLWKDKVDEFGGTELDAAVNIILLDDYFENEEFQRDKFMAAMGARNE